MKKIIITTATVLLFVMTLSAHAGIASNPLKNLNSNGIVATYVEAISLGNYDLNKYLFTKDFEYQSNNQKFNRKKYIQFLEKTKGAKYDCNTTYTILDETGSSCVAKVTMEFNTFTRVDHISLNHDQDGWKISKVITTYP